MSVVYQYPILSSAIQIGELKMDFAADVVINHSLKEYTNTATLEFAKKILVNKKDKWASRPIQDVIKAGDQVIVKLGYNGKNRTEFIGYVRNVNPKVPLQIECEDEMYMLKRLPVAPKRVSGKLQDVLDYIAPAYSKTAIILDTDLGGPFTVGMDDSDTALKVLQRVEEVYGLKSTFILKDGASILCVGTQYTSYAGSKAVKYILNENTIENDMEFVRAEDLKITVTAKSLQSNGKTLTAKFKGDKDGDARKIAIPGMSQAQLEAVAKRLYEKSKVSKMDGTITTFGAPYITAGMRANIDCKDFEIKQTENYVDEVQVKFGPAHGYRRILTLGPKA